jgi:exopolysaccharide biosynthesis polyprenyl glycosylphosphotransferase
MNTFRRRTLIIILKVFDLTLVAGAFLLASALKVRRGGPFGFAQFLATRITIRDLLLCFVVLLSWHVVFTAFKLYDSRRMSGPKTDCMDLLQATTIGTTVIAVIGYIFRVGIISSRFLLVFWVTIAACAVSHRLLQRFVLQRIRLKGRNLRNMLIVGANSRGLDFASRVHDRPELGYRVIGFVDERTNDATPTTTTYSILSDFANLPGLLRNTVVDEVVIALPVDSLQTHACSIVAMCEQQGITTRMLSNIFGLRVARVQADEFAGAALITNYTGLTEGWPVLVKRGLDVVISSALLLILLPVMLLIGLLIKLTSPGEVLFSQSRLGYNKRKFKIYKFRTMVADAEQRLTQVEHLNEMSGPVFKIREDPRVTTLGRVLRKTSLDELPQLVNVLKGDMSLVGPRPLPDRDYAGFQEDWQRRRFSVRPGITCLWQINGRNSIPFDKWMQMDLQYIDKWSLALDFQILVKTIPAVLKGSGAA